MNSKLLKSGHIKLYKRENSKYWQMKVKLPKLKAIRSSTGSKILKDAEKIAIFSASLRIFEPVDDLIAFNFGNFTFICQYFEFSLLYNFMCPDLSSFEFICVNNV